MEREKLKGLYEKWGTMKEVSRQTDLSYNAVKYWMNEYEIPKNSRRKTHQYGYWNNGEQPVDLEMCDEDEEEIVEKVKGLYYDKGCSAREVGEELGWSTVVVYDFMERNGLDRRSAKETNRIRFEKKEPSFKIKENLSEEEEKLKVAGIMLYWAEGTSSQKQEVDFTNSDPAMIKLFLEFLRGICGVKEERLRGYLYCYANQDVQALEEYWSKISGIPLDQFIKSYVRKDFDPEKKGKSEHGTFRVMYSDKKLFLQIQDWIKEYVNLKG